MNSCYHRERARATGSRTSGECALAMADLRARAHRPYDCSEMEIVNVMPVENQSVLPRVVQSAQIRMLGLVTVQNGAGADPMLA